MTRPEFQKKGERSGDTPSGLSAMSALSLSRLCHATARGELQSLCLSSSSEHLRGVCACVCFKHQSFEETEVTGNRAGEAKYTKMI